MKASANKTKWRVYSHRLPTTIAFIGNANAAARDPTSSRSMHQQFLEFSSGTMKVVDAVAMPAEHPPIWGTSAHPRSSQGDRVAERS
jgi:hypothetical protein